MRLFKSRGRAWMLGVGLLVGGCGEAGSSPFGGVPGGGGISDGAAEGSTGTQATDTGSATGGSSGESGPSDPTVDPTTATDPTESGGGAPITCAYPSTSFGSPLQELDVMDDPGSAVRLSFTVPGLPDADLISEAELRFTSYDADHPGEEGIIYVNGVGNYGIPANPKWENLEVAAAVDVLPDITGGTNTIEFGPGPLPRSFFRIGDVELVVTAQVDGCDAVDDPGSDEWEGVEQTLHYTEAEYTQRHNWVWRCNAGDYAFTGGNAKHVPDDCGGLYAPDGTAHGTATFRFADVVEDDYLVEVHAYHTWNRSPTGARIVVDGVTGFVDQRTSMEGESYFETASWGVAHLAGDVDIVLDSSQGGYASDAVSWIRIVPQ